MAATTGLRTLDTGLLYRAVAGLAQGHRRFARRRDGRGGGGSVGRARGARPRGAARRGIGGDASRVAAISCGARRPARAAAALRPKYPPGPLAGRDIGTVVCPDATLKIFVTASIEERARAPLRGVAGAGRSAYTRAFIEVAERDRQTESGRSRPCLLPRTPCDRHLDARRRAVARRARGSLRDTGRIQRQSNVQSTSAPPGFGRRSWSKNAGSHRDHRGPVTGRFRVDARREPGRQLEAGRLGGQGHDHRPRQRGRGRRCRLKSEGRVPIKEFSTPGHPVEEGRRRGRGSCRAASRTAGEAAACVAEVRRAR
ncbi:MAG: (d)CMP kinase [Geminicoccaceae bacterium]